MMWQFEHSEDTDASIESLWERISTPSHWPQQSKNVEWVKIDGPFQKDARLEMKPKGVNSNRVYKLKVIEFIPGKFYITQANLPLGHLNYEHQLDQVGENTSRLTYRVKITGPLSWLFGPLFGRKIAQDLPEGMQMIIDFAKRSE